MKFLPQFVANFITTGVNSRANGCFQVPWRSAEVTLHLTYTFFNDAAEGATPAGMKGADHSLLGVHQQDWKTIGGLNTQKQTRCIGYESISGQLARRRTFEDMNDV